MKKFYSFLILLLIHSNLNSQNLIPNPDFENTSTLYCGIFIPVDFNSSINSWYTPTQGSPDLFSTQISQACWNFQTNSTYGGPICLKGPQAPRSGNVFAGIGCYSIPGFNQREYIQSPLLNPLTPGNSYYVEFYTSFADNQQKYIDKLGAYFSELPISSSNDQVLNVVPQIEATTFISDTVIWVKISGVFQAAGAYAYITIGNFYDDVNTPTMTNPSGSTAPGCYGAYYFIDDVAVSDITAVNNLSENLNVKLFPNPFTGHLSVSITDYDAADFILYDVTHRKMVHQKFTRTLGLDTGSLSNGVYFYEITTKGGKTLNGKVVKNY